MFRLVQLGYRVVGFVHDEALIELPINCDYDPHCRQIDQITQPGITASIWSAAHLETLELEGAAAIVSHWLIDNLEDVELIRAAGVSISKPAAFGIRVLSPSAQHVEVLK